MLFSSFLLFSSESLDFIGLFFSLEFFLLSLGVTKNWFHLIMVILTLEMMSVLMFKLISVGVNLSFNSNIMFFYIALMVVEASLGMSLVVSNARSWSKESILA